MSYFSRLVFYKQSEMEEAYWHECCPECGADSIPAEGVLDQLLRGCPECGHTWIEELSQ